MDANVACKWIIVAERVDVDERELVTITRIFNMLGAPEVPYKETIGVATLWSGPRGQRAKGVLRVTHVDSGRGIDSIDLDLEFGPEGRGWKILTLKGEFHAFGDYRFEAVHRDVVQASEVLSIVPLGLTDWQMPSHGAS